jgi:hypothetical protein
LTPLLNFVIEDQQSVSTDGLVTVVDVDPPTYRKATFDDELKAIEVSMTTVALKGYIEDIIENCAKIESYASKKRLFMSKDDKVMIDIYSKFIKNTEDGILKLTNGKKARDYVYPYITRTIRQNFADYEKLMSTIR